MTPGPKFSRSTSAVFSSARKTSLPRGVLQVERQAALVGVEGEEEEAVGVGPVPLSVYRAGLALARLLDLDHVGAQPGQHLAARRPGLVVREIDDADARQRLTHGVPLSSRFYGLPQHPDFAPGAD